MGWKIHKTLILTDRDIARVLTMRETLRAVEAAFRAAGEGAVRMPPKQYLSLPEFGGDFRAMPAYLPTLGACGLKWINAHPGNARYGLPAVMGIILFNDPRTGFPLAVMSGTFITKMRTGAAGGIAAKYLARSTRHVALVGCGVQAESQLEALLECCPIQRVTVWGPTPQLVQRFLRRVRRLTRAGEPAVTVAACVRDADCIVTTTPVRRPIVRRAWLKPGVHINAIGADAPGKQELETRILRDALVVVDDWEQASHAGEINRAVAQGRFHRRDVAATLGEVVAKRLRLRRSARQMTVFDSTGLAIQDMAVAQRVYRLALRRGLGRWIRF